MTTQTEPLDAVSRTWQALVPLLEPQTRMELGQYKTPAGVARFMASLLASGEGECRLLDAGAGVGALTCAFLDRWVAGEFEFQSVEATAYEIDDRLREHLSQQLKVYSGVQKNIIAGDFIALAAQAYLWGGGGYTHAILNPPYKKIGSHSQHRLILRQVGIETVNLYSAFVALAIALAAPGGQIVALIPRSFCNGPYYRSFRAFMLERAALKSIHLFDSRHATFKADSVLQENVIIHLERGGQQGPVTISTSTDDTFSDLVKRQHLFEQIILPDDPEQFIHIPTLLEQNEPGQFSAVACTLSELGIQVSTGPVVDFRLKEHLRSLPQEGTVPLLYPAHFGDDRIRWPNVDSAKPNAIDRNAETEKWLYPSGFYCVIKRFSAKEERRRIAARVIDPSDFGDAQRLGFENHLNILHDNKKGLPAALAYGLALYLSSTAADQQFRRFSGHTQVNATDLRQMMYPSRAILTELGEWARQQQQLTQAQIDAQVEGVTR